jgi:hypothetical protein
MINRGVDAPRGLHNANFDGNDNSGGSSGGGAGKTTRAATVVDAAVGNSRAQARICDTGVVGIGGADAADFAVANVAARGCGVQNVDIQQAAFVRTLVDTVVRERATLVRKTESATSSSASASLHGYFLTADQRRQFGVSLPLPPTLTCGSEHLGATTRSSHSLTPITLVRLAATDPD